MWQNALGWCRFQACYRERDNPSEGPQTGFLTIFGRFLVVWGSGSGLKMLLGPVRSFSRSRFLISSILDPFRVNFGLLDPPLYCVFLQDRECSSSATRKFSPNPSYLRSGELVLPWDTKNRSSHTQIVHIDILRAQMYLKSAIWAHGPTGPKGPGPRAHGPSGPTGPGPRGPLGPGPGPTGPGPKGPPGIMKK